MIDSRLSIIHVMNIKPSDNDSHGFCLLSLLLEK
jgi:hypothetical protein